MVSGFVYAKHAGTLRKITSQEEVENLSLGADEILWVNLFSPKEKEWKLLEQTFSFHPLTIEDCMNQDQRPKVEDYGEYLFIVTQWANLADEELRTSELDIYISKNFIVTVHQEEIPVLQSTADRCDKNLSLPERGTDYLLYMILDSVVDHYFPLLEELEDRLDVLEQKVINPSGREVLSDIFSLRQTLTSFRKIIAPQRELFALIMSHQYGVIHKNTFVYLRDVYDHVMRIYEMIEFERETLTSCLEVYLSSTSNRMNGIMKTLTIITTVFMPLTFLTGMLGMNFSRLPLLGWNYSHAFELFFLLTFGVSLAMVLFFKRKKWF